MVNWIFKKNPRFVPQSISVFYLLKWKKKWVRSTQQEKPLNMCRLSRIILRFVSLHVTSAAWRGLLFMSAHYWADKMDHLVSSLILSPSFLSSSMLSGQKPSALWKPAMWHLAASAAPEGQKGPRFSFHGDAEKQLRLTRHPPAPRPLRRGAGGRLRVRLLPVGTDAPAAASGDVWARATPQVKAAKHQVYNEQKHFPLDERVQKLRPESGQENSRSVWHKKKIYIYIKKERRGGMNL